MVHNGIEYADMQLIAEAYDLLRHALGAPAAELAQVFAEWNTGDLESYLIEITAEVLAHTDPVTGAAFVDVVLDQAEQKGTGRWTVQSALDLGVPVTGIAEATFARALSGSVPQRTAGRGLPAGTTPWQVADRDAFVEDVRRALYASKVVAYSQGFDQIAAASAEHGWDVDRGAMARIWRGGCIIRAKFLDRITEAYERDPGLALLLADPYFTERRRRGPGVLAPGGRAWPRPTVCRRPRSPRPWRTTTRSAPSACRPTWSRPSATTSARTPTGAPTRTASSTPSGPATTPSTTPDPAPPGPRDRRSDVRTTARRVRVRTRWRHREARSPRGPGLSASVRQLPVSFSRSAASASSDASVPAASGTGAEE